MCCGSEQDLYNPTRFGALAVLSGDGPRSSPSSLSGKVVLFNQEDVRSATATHVKLILDDGSRPLGDLSLSIFSTGDLTLPRSQCARAEIVPLSAQQYEEGGVDTSAEFELRRQVQLSVGGEGIIGRRIALTSASCRHSTVEGIVGYNHAVGVAPLVQT